MGIQYKIKCPLCKAKIPSDAAKCSHCAGDLSSKEIREKIEKEIRKNKINSIIIAVIFIGILAWSLGSLTKNPPSSSTSSSGNNSNFPTTPITQNQEEKSPAYMLAGIELQKLNPPATLVNQFDDLLDSLQRKCKEKDRELLSDYIVKSKELIERDGGKTTLLNFAKALNESIPEELAPMSCKDMAAILIAMMVANK